MTATEIETKKTAEEKSGWAASLAVYFSRDVLTVILLGFSAGLPLALSGSTLLIWMTEAGVDLRTIGLFAFVGTPYTFKFLWAPLVDALDIPILGRLLGRRRGWLIFSQMMLIGAILFMSTLDPISQTWTVALGAVLIATASATQDIVIDTYRIEKLAANEQAAGMGGYVAAYRIGMLASTAGALFVVTYFQTQNLDHQAAWGSSYKVMSALVVVGMLTTVFAAEPKRADQAADLIGASRSPLARIWATALGAFVDFFKQQTIIVAIAALCFVVLFKLSDAFAGAMIGTFAIKIGFSRDAYATIVKGVGLAATLGGGIIGGMIAKRLSLISSLWLGGILQTVANLTFSVQALVGANLLVLGLAITIENFTSAIGTVFFIAYLSSLCRNPLHTATQFALLTALASFGRTVLASQAGTVAEVSGWPMFFVIATLTGIPAFLLLWWLQARGHFAPKLAG